MNTIIITDSTCDLKKEVQHQLGVEVVPLTVSYENTDYKDNFHGIARRIFYQKLRSGKIQPMTSQPSPQAFLEIFRKHKNLGNSVIYIGIASNSSGTLQAARIAKQMCNYDNIYIVDSMHLSHGIEVLVRIACQMRDEGADAGTIAERITALVPQVRFISYVDNLKFLSHGGRVKSYSPFDDGKLNVKTLVSMVNGRFTPVGIGRGKQNAFEKMYEFIRKNIPEEKLPIVLTHADNSDSLNSFEQFLKKKGLSYNFTYSEIGAVIGSHMGPGTIGIAYIAKTV